MSIIRSFIAKLLRAGSRLSVMEKMVLDSVREHLKPQITELWVRQVLAIDKVQRIPEGVEVNFYRMEKGRPSFDQALAFPNKKTELLLANVQAELADVGKLNAKVWCVKGFVFSIEYDGSVSYFEEVANMDPRPEFKFTCELKADLAAA